MEIFLFTIMFLITILFLTSLIGLINASPNKKKGKWLTLIVDHKTSLLIFGISFILFFSYFAATAQLLQLEETINIDSVSYTISNNNYLFFYGFLPLIQGLFAMTTMFCIGTVLRSYEILGRGRMA
jgi:hypothetical protein